MSDKATAVKTEDTHERPTASSLHAPIRRRNRIISSCLPCRQRKIKCDKLAPCTNCARFNRECLYLAPALDSAAQQKLTEIKNRLGHLEESLGRDVARRTIRTGPARASSSRSARDDEDDDDEDDDSPHEAEDEKGLEPTPLAAFDQFYEDDADDELMDLGIQLGRVRLTDRVGGLVRPKMADEIGSVLGPQDQDRRRKNPNVFRHAYGYSNQVGTWPRNPALPETYMAPGPDYIAPASNFFFPDTTASGAAADYIPPRNVADQLITQYLVAVHPIARLVHRATFENQYGQFCDCIARGTPCAPPIQAIMLAAMFSAAVSLADEAALALSGMPKIALVERLRATAERFLSNAHVLRTTKVDTLQAFIMYLLPLCRTEISRAHSALTGTAIRLAQCMGLHRDGTLYGLSPVETHVRRLIWHHLCFLDVRTCEATGPRPQIRKEDYDTKLPLNVNDIDLVSTPAPQEDSRQFTEMTLTRVKIECYELIRQLWDDMPRIDRKKTTLTAVLGKIQRFRATMEARYSPLLQGNSPLQLLTKHLYRALSNKCFVVVLQRYVVSTSTTLPDRLKQVLLNAALCSMESAIAMDAQPELKLWSWYRGAVIQYHAAMLLLLDVYLKPDIPEAIRIWPVLDYVFDLQPNMHPKEKAGSVIMELQDRLEMYHTLRKTRATTEMLSHTSGESKAQQQVPRTSPASRVEEAAQGMAALQAAATHIQGQSYSSPTDSNGSQQGFLGPNLDLPTDTTMQGMPDIDWHEWEKYFPQGVQSILGNMDVPHDIDLAGFNPHTAYMHIPKPPPPPH